jgi:hypothetical protein
MSVKYARVYLTRRNLLTLLSKLDRRAKGEVTVCTIIKQDINHPRYPCTDVIAVTAVENDDYYTDRPPGEVLFEDDPKNTPWTGNAADVAHALEPSAPPARMQGDISVRP